MTFSVNWRAFSVSTAIMALGIVALWQAAAIPVTQVYSQVSGSFFPYLIGIGIVACGAVLLVRSLNGGWNCLSSDRNEPPSRLAPLGWILAAYAVTGLSLIATNSFILSATLLFSIGVRAFRRGLWLKSIGLGICAGLFAYMIFSVMLGLQIGEGFPERAVLWALRFWI
jgi:putative tricarboxylic transport membrane protein